MPTSWGHLVNQLPEILHHGPSHHLLIWFDSFLTEGTTSQAHWACARTLAIHISSWWTSILWASPINYEPLWQIWNILPCAFIPCFLVGDRLGVSIGTGLLQFGSLSKPSDTIQHEIIPGEVCFHALLELEVAITLITTPPHRLTLALKN